MTGTFKLARNARRMLPLIVAWKVISEDGRLIRLYWPAEAEAQFKHSDLYGRTRALWITPIFERRGR